jgi:hypothetical protein
LAKSAEIWLSGRHVADMLPTFPAKITDRGTNTLAACGLEELFFQLCCCVRFWFWQEIGFSFTYYLCN